jgi:hypothetical protein
VKGDNALLDRWNIFEISIMGYCHSNFGELGSYLLRIIGAEEANAKSVRASLFHQQSTAWFSFHRNEGCRIRQQEPSRFVLCLFHAV